MRIKVQLHILIICLSQIESFGTVFQGLEANSYTEFSYFKPQICTTGGEIGTTAQQNR